MLGRSIDIRMETSLSLCSWAFYLWWDFYDSQIEGCFDCFYLWA
jgi:hypothetical protein